MNIVVVDSDVVAAFRNLSGSHAPASLPLS